MHLNYEIMVPHPLSGGESVNLEVVLTQNSLYEGDKRMKQFCSEWTRRRSPLRPLLASILYRGSVSMVFLRENSLGRLRQKTAFDTNKESQYVVQSIYRYAISLTSGLLCGAMNKKVAFSDVLVPLSASWLGRGARASSVPLVNSLKAGDAQSNVSRCFRIDSRFCDVFLVGWVRLHWVWCCASDQ